MVTTAPGVVAPGTVTVPGTHGDPAPGIRQVIQVPGTVTVPGTRQAHGRT